MKNKFSGNFFILLLLLLIGIFLLISCNGECSHRDVTKKVISPTCGERGYTLFVCSDCSFSFESDFVAPSPHSLVTTVVAPTCESGGYTLNECSTCDYSYTSEPLAMKEHIIVSKTIAPTCRAEGYTQKKCEVCSYIQKTDFISPAEHDIKATVIAPTCEKAGYTNYKCTKCNFEYDGDNVTALVHDFNIEIIPPACLTEGYTKSTCSICQKVIKSDITAPTDHTYTDTVFRATASKNGYTLHKCEHCNYEYTSDNEYSYSIFMGAYTPSNTVLTKGIDVSSYNGTLSWSAIANADVDFAILRAGTSSAGEDSLFAYNYRNAKAYGLGVGVYYYVEARSVEEILTYAQKLKTILDGKKFEYPIYLDIEKDSLGAELGKDLLTQMAVAFLEDLQKDGYFAALYTNNNWLENFYHKDALTSLYDVWYARYIPTDKISEPVWDLEKYGSTMGMWQYTQEGTLQGVTSSIPFDLDLCYRDYPTIIKRFHYNGY